MPLRADGPDIVSKADKRAIAREHAKRKRKHFGSKGHVTTYTGKPKGDPVFGFVKKAASAIGGLPEAVSSEAKEVYRGAEQAMGLTNPRNPRRRQGASVVREVQRSGREAVRAYIKDRQNAVTPWALKSPAQKRYTRAHPDEMATGPKIMQIIKEGEAVLLGRAGQKAGLDEIEDMLEGLPVTVARKHPGRNRLYTQDIGYPWRMPFLTAKQRGHINLGDFGESHGGLLRTMFPRGITPEIAGRYRQGMISRPDSSALGRVSTGVSRQDVGDIRLDLGYGRVWDRPPPENIAPTHKMLMHLLRNYPDEAVQIGWGNMRMGGRYGSAPRSPSRDDMFEQWIEDMEASYKPHNFYSSFGRTEKKRRRKR